MCMMTEGQQKKDNEGKKISKHVGIKIWLWII